MGNEGDRSVHIDGGEAGWEGSGDAHVAVVPVPAVPQIHRAGQ